MVSNFWKKETKMTEQKVRKTHILSNDQIKQIAREYALKGASGLSRELGISKQGIFYHVRKLRRRGVDIPKPKSYPKYGMIVEELKNEHQIVEE